MDVCAEVMSIISTDNHLKLKIKWVNLGYVESYYIFRDTAWIRIKKSALNDWDWSNITDDLCFRNNNWRPISNIINIKENE